MIGAVFAWWIEEPGPIDTAPLRSGERPDPTPAPHEVLVRVAACGVCRTDLHLAEGDLAPHRPRTVPGHEIVGHVIARGRDTTRFEIGDRIGIAWLRWTCGVCAFCRSGRENLCLAPAFTGWDADGGYAGLAVVHEDYAYAIPDLRSPTRRRRRCCAQASSATGRCGAAPCPREDDSASTGSGRRRISRRRSRCTKA